MPAHTETCSEDGILNLLKVVSGRRLEDERRRRRMTQRQVARQVGMSVRWLREIEAGNPIVKLDDHLICAAKLQLAPSYIFLPLLYQRYGQCYPAELSYADLADIEQRCLSLVMRRAKLIGRDTLR